MALARPFKLKLSVPVAKIARNYASFLIVLVLAG